MANNERALSTASMTAATMLAVVTDGDCSRLTDEQKLSYYRARCEAAGLDPRAQPFMFTRLNNKLVLYAVKAATDQLAAQHGIACAILDQKTEGGIRIVTVQVRAKDGRQTEDIGCVEIAGKGGAELCNALMKAVTKAKRRAILSLCGLGMMDETELDTVPHVVESGAETAHSEPPKTQRRGVLPAAGEAAATNGNGDTPAAPAPRAGDAKPASASEAAASDLPPAPDNGTEIELQGHKCKQCHGAVYKVWRGSPKSKNPGRPYLACAREDCKQAGRDGKDYPTFNGWWDEVIEKYGNAPVETAQEGGAA